MKWTETKPMTEGWYWCMITDTGDPEIDYICIHEGLPYSLEDCPIPLKRSLRKACREFSALYIVGEFYGPLEPPPHGQ